MSTAFCIILLKLAKRISVVIHNADATHKFTYHPWRLSNSPVRLVDQFGNNYKEIMIPAVGDVLFASADESIYPKDAVIDTLVFEAPVKGAQLKLILPRKNIGEDGETEIDIVLMEPKRKLHAIDRD